MSFESGATKALYADPIDCVFLEVMEQLSLRIENYWHRTAYLYSVQNLCGCLVNNLQFLWWIIPLPDYKLTMYVSCLWLLGLGVISVRYFNSTSFLIQEVTVFLLQPILSLNFCTENPHILPPPCWGILFDLALKAQRTRNALGDKAGLNSTSNGMSYKRGALLGVHSSVLYTKRDNRIDLHSTNTKKTGIPDPTCLLVVTSW